MRRKDGSIALSMAKDRSHWVQGKHESFEDMRVSQLQAWQRVSGAQRRAAAWELVLHYWQKKGYTLDELRLQRTVGGLKRG